MSCYQIKIKQACLWPNHAADGMKHALRKLNCENFEGQKYETEKNDIKHPGAWWWVVCLGAVWGESREGQAAISCHWHFVVLYENMF